MRDTCQAGRNIPLPLGVWPKAEKETANNLAGLCAWTLTALYFDLFRKVDQGSFDRCEDSAETPNGKVTLSRERSMELASRNPCSSRDLDNSQLGGAAKLRQGFAITV